MTDQADLEFIEQAREWFERKFKITARAVRIEGKYVIFETAHGEYSHLRKHVEAGDKP